MKKAFLLPVITSILFACNSDSNNHTAMHDTVSHGDHAATGPGAKDQGQTNPITDAMDKMMRDMHGAKPSGNNNIDFAAMMLEHHKGAVEMSKVELDKGSNADLKTIAQKVIADQNKEIGFLQSFISKATKTPSPNSAEFQKALNNSMMAMMDSKPWVYNDIDKDFAAQMIPHHQSAVDMAKAYLKYEQDTELAALCRNIISSQEKEISWLKEWLASNVK